MMPVVRRARFMSCALALLIPMVSGDALGQSVNPSDKDSDGRFTGIALITDDRNWHALFARRETPRITGRDHFEVGERGVLAILFSNAEPREGRVRVICDVTAFDPEGSRQVVDSKPCYDGPFAGPNTLHPAQLDLQVEIGADEPDGRAGFELKLRDAFSGREVRLVVSFTQGDPE